MPREQLIKLHNDLSGLQDMLMLYPDPNHHAEDLTPALAVLERMVAKMGPKPEPDPLRTDFQVRQTESENTLQHIGQLLIQLIPPHQGYIVLLFDYGDSGNLFYLSTANRKEAIETMREFISKQEQKPA